MQDTLARIKSEFKQAHPDFLYSEGNSLVYGVAGKQTGIDTSFLGIVGSISHNTYVPKDDPDSIDDIDIMGVVPLAGSHLFGLKMFEHWVYKEDEIDAVLYSLPKFANLLLKGNPNVMGLLWLREEDQLQVPEWWNRLVDNKHMFTSKKNVYDAFVGYAKGQMERMITYTPEIHEELQYLEMHLASYGITKDDVMNNRTGTPSARILSEKIKRFRDFNKKFHLAYMGDKRKRLVIKHGYDTKNAAHMVRLLAMAVEYLDTGEMNVFRTHDVDDLRSIKRGEWSLEGVNHRANLLFDEAKVAYGGSTLPEFPDYENVNDLIGEIAQENC